MLFPKLLFLLAVVVSSASDRTLELGDFEVINDLYQDVSFPLEGNPQIVENTGAGTLTLDLSNIVCRGLQIGDIQIDWKTNPTRAFLQLIAVDVTCRVDYRYNYLIFNGGGSADLITSNNHISAAMVLNQNVVTVTNCSADQVNVDKIDFNGDGLGLVASVLDTLNFAITGMVEEKMSSFFCDFLGTLEDKLNGGVASLIKKLSPFANETVHSSDPLAAEQALMSTSSSSSVELVNFQNPSSTVAELTVTLLSAGSGYLSQPSEDGTMNVNVLIGGMLDNGALEVNVSQFLSNSAVPTNASSPFGTFSFVIESASLVGLDSVTNFSGIDAIGAYTLSTGMELASVSLKLQGEVFVQPPGANEPVSLETVVISVPFSDISINLAMLIAIDEGKLGQVPMGALLDLNMLPCLGSALYQLEVTDLQIEIGTLEPLEVDGLQSPGLDRLLSDGLVALYAAFEPLLSQALPNLVESVVVDLVSETVDNAVHDLPQCTVPPGSNASFVDFRELFLTPEEAVAYGATGNAPYGSLASLATGFIDDNLLRVNPQTNISGLAEMLIIPMTEGRSGEAGALVMKKDLVNIDREIELGYIRTPLTLRVSDAKIENLDSMGPPLYILEPVVGEAYQLNNTLTLGVPPSPLRLGANILFQIGANESMIRNELGIMVELHSFNVFAALMGKMSEASLLSFPIEDIFNYYCWLSTFPAPELDEAGIRVSNSDVSLAIAELSASIDAMNFSLDCIECLSPKFQELADRLATAEGNEAATQSATNALNTLLSYVQGVDSIVQVELDRLLVDAPKMCPHRPEYDPSAMRTKYDVPATEPTSDSSAMYLIALIAAMLGVAVAAIGISCLVRWIVARRHRKWLETLPEDRLLAVYENQKELQEEEAAKNTVSRPMYLSDELPLLARVLVPFILLGNIALFLSGHLSKGGEVRIYLQIGGQTMMFDNFYTFSIAQSGIELWKAGARELAILLLLFSGVWPYLKTLITLALWFVPTRFCPLQKRGSILSWLDFLTKWSMADVFTMIVTLAAFRVTIQSPDLSFLPDELYQVDLLVVPVWGLYSNMLAQILSQIISHVVIHYHRTLIKAATAKAGLDSEKSTFDVELDSIESAKDSDDAEEPPETAFEDVSSEKETQAPAENLVEPDPKDESDLCPLNQHHFMRPHRGEEEKLAIRSGVNIGVIAMSLLVFLLIMLGCTLPAFSFDYQGLVGVLVESGNDFAEARAFYSVISLAQMLMDQARFLDQAKDYIGLFSVAVLLTLTTLIVPIALLSVLLVEWFLPLRKVIRNRLRVTVEILAAWQYVEVFLLSVIVACWQIGDVSEFMINPYCGDLSRTLSALAANGVLKAEDATCFRVQATVDYASYILIAAAALLLLMSSFVSKAVIQRTRDEEFLSHPHHRRHVGSGSSDDSAAAVKPPIDKIQPVPALFTDQFRWCLKSASS